MQAIIRNQSGEKHYLIQQFSYNRNIDEPYYSILIALYSFLIIFGAAGNVLVVLAVLRNKQMQTARWVNHSTCFQMIWHTASCAFFCDGFHLFVTPHPESFSTGKADER